MRDSIKNKITFYLSLGIIFIMIFSTFSMKIRIQENIEDHIKKDIEKIISYAKKSFDTTIKAEENDYWNITTRISDTFDVYANFTEKISESKGKVINLDDIEFYLNLTDNNNSYLKLSKGIGGYSGTIVYPIYVDQNYIGKLIIQKNYTDIYDSNYNLLSNIIGSQLLLTIILIVIMYLVVSKITDPLSKLTIAIKKFGLGKDVNYIDVKSNDEIGEITKEFNEMKENINYLNNSTKEFFNLATHELKTPLTSIRGYSQMLTEEKFEDEFISRAVNRIEEESVKMSKLVQNLLYVAKSEVKLKPTKELFNVKDVINEMLLTVNPEIINNGIKVDLKVDNIFIDTVKEDVQIVISNLINNSIRYTANNEVEIELINNHKYVELIIENLQTNINEKIRDKLFNAFVKSENNKMEISSSGLGLYICKSVCDRNRWEIEYYINNDKISFKFKINKEN